MVPENLIKGPLFSKRFAERWFFYILAGQFSSGRPFGNVSGKSPKPGCQNIISRNPAHRVTGDYLGERLLTHFHPDSILVAIIRLLIPKSK